MTPHIGLLIGITGLIICIILALPTNPPVALITTLALVSLANIAFAVYRQQRKDQP